MARVVNVHEAKTSLSKLLEAVENGEEITIARAGVPCAKLVPLTDPPKRKRELGFLRDILPPIPDELFFEPMPEEELALWEAVDDLLLTLPSSNS